MKILYIFCILLNSCSNNVFSESEIMSSQNEANRIGLIFDSIAVGDNLSALLSDFDESDFDVENLFRGVGIENDESVFSVKSRSEPDQWVTLCYKPRMDVFPSELKRILTGKEGREIRIIVSKVIR
jgi:hypothetical protein